MLYVFAGFPRNGLNAGGLQCAIEEVEELGLLEHDTAVQYCKEGGFTVTDGGKEWRRHFDYHISDLCLRDGITWDWFPENWSFGNGVTVHKTLASAEYRTVVHGTNLTLEEFLALNGPTRLADLELVREHYRHEGWEKYESRWTPGTCPQESHIVHLTWLVTIHRVPEFAYQRIRALVEAPDCQPDYLNGLESKYFSEARTWHGKPSFHEGHRGANALPST